MSPTGLKPAFPTSPTGVLNNQGDTYGGLTKREYFAAKAMQGMLGSFSYPISEWVDKHTIPIIVSGAFRYADAMIAELEKEKECQK